MPFVVTGARKGGRILAASIALAAISAAPASAAGTTDKKAAANPDACVVDHTFSHPFAAWNDFADYALAPGGNFETGAAGWKLSRSTVTSGNQPFAASGRSSLRLPAGASATSAPMCIDSRYPHFRVFARNTGRVKTTLKAEVLYLNSKGGIKATASGNIVSPSTAWFPSDSLKIGVTFNAAIAAGAAPVAFRFTSASNSDWLIDDVFVDPYARR